VIAFEDASSVAATPAQVVAARHEAGEKPHTELMTAHFEAEKILTYTTSSPPRLVSMFGSDVMRSVDPERNEEPHTPERDANPVLLNAAYSVTGAASPADDATSEASAASGPVAPFMNRAARRAAARQQRKHQGRPRSTRLHG
jgi:hypothetical protein